MSKTQNDFLSGMEANDPKAVAELAEKLRLDLIGLEKTDDIETLDAFADRIARVDATDGFKLALILKQKAKGRAASDFLAGKLRDYLKDAAATVSRATMENNLAVGAPKLGAKEFVDPAALVNVMNEKCAAVMVDGVFRYVVYDGKSAIFLSDRDAKNKFAPYRFRNTNQNGTLGTPEPAFPIWNTAESRKEFERVEFQPDEMNLRPGSLNLWQGFAKQSKAGDWSRFKAHLLDNVCSGNQTYFNFLLDWCAQLLQQPGKKSGVAVILQGEEGVGKSILGDILCVIIGEAHSHVAEKEEQIVGRFTNHLRQNIFLLCEESFFAGDPRIRGPLWHLITGVRGSYEAKGRDLIQAGSFTHVMIATNKELAVPADPKGARRVFLLKVAPTKQRDENYFNAITAQMGAGGYEAMLHDLLARDISKTKFQQAPVTDALKDQVAANLQFPESWLYSALCDGEFPSGAEGEPIRLDCVGLDKKPMENLILKDFIVHSYRAAAPTRREERKDQQAVGIFLGKVFPTLDTTRKIKSPGQSDRSPHYGFPSLEVMRSAFSARYPLVPAFPPIKLEEDTGQGEPSSNVVPMVEKKRTRF